ncbi:MAG TPA: hypothetical protein VFS55_02080 [Dokdonella sp.]|nr:hypothetical protein [Dokdonella sp.]
MLGSFLLLASCTRPPTEKPETASCFEVCYVSLLQLIADPVRYEQKRVSVVGYLAIYDHVLALYPTEAQYKIVDIASSVGFRVPASKQQAFADTSLYKYVRVDGVFSSRFRGFDGARAGDFTTVTSLAVIKTMGEGDHETSLGVPLEFLDE